MGASNKVCPVCGRKMKQQFIGLQHCKWGMSWKKDLGFFERTSDMGFALERRTGGEKGKQVPGGPRKDWTEKHQQRRPADAGRFAVKGVFFMATTRLMFLSADHTMRASI